MSKDRKSYWEQKIRESGLRLTRARREIIEVLVDHSGPLSAREIFLILRSAFSPLELSTVYRNLHTFCARGMLREVDLGMGEKKFEFNSGEHRHHLICMKCGEVRFLGCPLPHLEDDISKKTSYDVVEHRLNVYGFCPICRNG